MDLWVSPGKFRWSAHWLGGAMCRDHVQCPAFALCTSEMAVGLEGGGCTLWFIICPNCACVQLFLVLCSFFLFCCSRRLCLGISASVKGPRCLSPIHKNFLMVILFRSFTSFLFCYLDLLCSESDELELLLLACFCFSLHVLVTTTNRSVCFFGE